jgi:hypothetical protein
MSVTLSTGGSPIMTTALSTSPPRAPRTNVARAGASSGFRLRGRAHKAALTAHVLSSVGWFGIAVTVAFAAITAGVTDDATLAHALYRTIEVVPLLSIPLGLVAVATGALLGVGTKWGLVRHWWVVAKVGISAAVIVTDAFIVGNAAHDVAAGGAVNGLYGPVIAHVVVLAVATVLSVFKPRGRTPFGRVAVEPATG